MNEKLKINIENKNKAIYMCLNGDLDLSSTIKFRELLLDHVTKENVFLNLENLEYIDSSGLAALIEGHQEAKKNKKELILTSIHPKILSILEMAQLHTILNITTND